MKSTVILILISVFLLSSCTSRRKVERIVKKMNVETQESTKDGVLIHISSDFTNHQRILMPLKMADIMSKDKDVLIYVDIDAIGLVYKEGQNPMFEEMPYVKDMISKLIDKGVRICVCPTCLEVAGKTDQDLLPGVELAYKNTFFSFTKGRIVTLDY